MLLYIEQILYAVYIISYIEIHRKEILNANHVNQTCFGLTCVKWENEDSRQHFLRPKP